MCTGDEIIANLAQLKGVNIRLVCWKLCLPPHIPITCLQPRILPDIMSRLRGTMSSAEELKGIPCRQRGKSRTRRGGKRRVQKSEQVLPPTNGGDREHGLEAGRGSSLSLPPVDSERNKDRDTVGGFLPRNAVFGGCQKSEKLCEHKHKHKSCHSFMTKSPTGARSRIHSTMIQRHRYAPPKALSKSQKSAGRDEIDVLPLSKSLQRATSTPSRSQTVGPTSSATTMLPITGLMMLSIYQFLG